jgi:hypothetical protein
MDTSLYQGIRITSPRGYFEKPLNNGLRLSLTVANELKNPEMKG